VKIFKIKRYRTLIKSESIRVIVKCKQTMVCHNIYNLNSKLYYLSNSYLGAVVVVIVW